MTLKRWKAAYAQAFQEWEGIQYPVVEEPTPYQAPEKEVTPEVSSTQLNLPEDVANEVKELAQTIDSADLAGDGVELEPHITVKYGLHTQDAAEVAKLVEGFGPVAVELEAISIFPAEEATAQRGGEQFDVVKLDVAGNKLHELNELLSNRLPHSDSHPEYQPHVTLAYVKPGRGKKYEGESPFQGTMVLFHSLTFCSGSGEKTEIPLRIKAAPPQPFPPELPPVRGKVTWQGFAPDPQGDRVAYCAAGKYFSSQELARKYLQDANKMVK